MDKEYLRYIKETGYNDLLDFDEETIAKYKNTLHYQMWRVRDAYRELGRAMLKAYEEIIRGIKLL